MDKEKNKLQIAKDTYILPSKAIDPSAREAAKQAADNLWLEVKGSIDRSSIRPLFPKPAKK